MSQELCWALESPEAAGEMQSLPLRTLYSERKCPTTLTSLFSYIGLE